MKFLILAVLLTLLTVAMHCVGSYAAMTQGVRLQRKHATRYWLRIVLAQTYVVTLMLIVHLCEAALWAAAYCWLDALSDFPTAMYYSLSSYSTVGYGDVVLPHDWRTLGPIESIVGVLMLGWSTAVIVALLQDFFHEQRTS
ncbi:potassium channel family protein [Roseimaritima ulvae]|uniref:Ion channel n=1 Tax=Roseimaritima ulvae TaxID=980254 RepID=A0A5B9QVT0_9BACT|nr:potassium channel family protein [Roseimaritima ulvae]QEG43148.1 Ion channel [Roseimaritima ulvae]